MSQLYRFRSKRKHIKMYVKPRCMLNNIISQMFARKFLRCLLYINVSALPLSIEEGTPSGGRPPSQTSRLSAPPEVFCFIFGFGFTIFGIFASQSRYFKYFCLKEVSQVFSLSDETSRHQRDFWLNSSGTRRFCRKPVGPLRPPVGLFFTYKATWKRGFNLPWRKAGLLISSRWLSGFGPVGCQK